MASQVSKAFHTQLMRPRAIWSFHVIRSLLIGSIVVLTVSLGFRSAAYANDPQLGNWAASHAKDLARGKQLYKLCAACHEQDGRGNQQHNAPAIAGLGSWYIEAQLHKFREGQRGYHAEDVAALQMRPMARALRSDDDIRAVATYIATLPPIASVATVSGDVERGKNLYTTCSACHGQDGKGNEEVKSPGLLHQLDWYVVAQMKKFHTGQRGAHKDDASGMQMRAMSMMLQDEQAFSDIAAYVLTLRK
jgi:cytochrome c oxidase subunit 2